MSLVQREWSVTFAALATGLGHERSMVNDWFGAARFGVRRGHEISGHRSSSASAHCRPGTAYPSSIFAGRVDVVTALQSIGPCDYRPFQTAQAEILRALVVADLLRNDLMVVGTNTFPLQTQEAGSAAADYSRSIARRCAMWRPMPRESVANRHRCPHRTS